MTKEEADPDFCPDTLTGRHAWYQTTLDSTMRCGDNTKEEESKENGHVSASHACKCGQWRITYYPLPKY